MGKKGHIFKQDVRAELKELIKANSNLLGTIVAENLEDLVDRPNKLINKINEKRKFYAKIAEKVIAQQANNNLTTEQEIRKEQEQQQNKLVREQRDQQSREHPHPQDSQVRSPQNQQPLRSTSHTMR